jgi:hypothetical protein
MIHGYTPFCGKNPKEIFNKIKKKDIGKVKI